MSLNFTEIEIKTLHSLDSWHGGVLVMVSGSLQTKGSNSRRRFVQTFFLAPQEKGYFVLNDIFRFFDEEQIHQHPGNNLTHDNFVSELNATNSVPEPGISLHALHSDKFQTCIQLADVKLGISEKLLN